MFSFVVTTHQGDVHLALRTLEGLAHFHPTAPRIVITDGRIDTSSLKKLGEYTDVDMLVEGGELTAPSLGTAWLERLLKTMQYRTLSPFVFKIDPDTLLTRAFQDPPDTDFLSVPGDGGGAYGLSRRAVNMILESEVLSKLTSRNYRYQRRDGRYAVLEDIQLRDAVRIVGLRRLEWKEFGGLRWPTPYTAQEISEVGQRWPILHPVLDLG